MDLAPTEVKHDYYLYTTDNYVEMFGRLTGNCLVIKGCIYPILG
jgi:hypothetical protein